MRIFKTRRFALFARREHISDPVLSQAVREVEAGLIDADLGGGLLKKRVARPGQGKSGGYRVLLFFRAADRTIFASGFAKSDRDNLDADELRALKEAAKVALGLSAEELAADVESGRLIELENDDACPEE